MSEQTYQFVVRQGPNPGQVYELLAETLTIGRDPLSDIIITDPEVSRQHVRLTRTDTGYQIQDLGSTNGTFVNGRRLEGKTVALTPGQEVMLGSGVVLLYREAVETAEEDLAHTLTPAQETQEDSGETAVGETAVVQPNEPDAGQDGKEETPPQKPEGKPTPPPTPLTMSGSEKTSVPHEEKPPSQPLVPSSESTNKRRRNTLISIGVVALLLCCCGFLAFMYYYGGDWLLQQMGLIP